jgi:hypothetical protein
MLATLARLLGLLARLLLLAALLPALIGIVLLLLIRVPFVRHAWLLVYPSPKSQRRVAPGVPFRAHTKA